LLNLILPALSPFLDLVGHTKSSDRSFLYSTCLFLASCTYAATASLECAQILERRRWKKTRSSTIDSHHRDRLDNYLMFQAAMAFIATTVVFAVFCITLVKRQVDVDLLLVNGSI
jgi:hypothetical protein